jgi:D-glycero-beta-D-manno-heptose 1-phosphate adenylyltransferase
MKSDLGTPADVKHKVVENYDSLLKLVEGLRVVNNKIVVTIGSWDLLHIGHVRYLRRAKSHGDVLIVGVDSDRTVKKYKGELRPIVPYEERCEMLTYQSCVDFVTNIDDVDKKGHWLYGLIKKIKPDVFVAVEDSYPKSQLTEIKKHCGELIILPRQAEKTSTTKMIQFAVKKHLDKMYELLDKRGK